MKFENFKKASLIVKDIEGYQDALDTISDPGYSVIVKAANSKTSLIEVKQGFENEYSEFADDLIERMKKYMQNKISALKTQLSDL